MKEGNVVTCPDCKGKGHVLDGGATGLLTIGWFGLGLLFAALETNDPNGLTRAGCARCKGSGFIRVRVR